MQKIDRYNACTPSALRPFEPCPLGLRLSGQQRCHSSSTVGVLDPERGVLQSRARTDDDLPTQRYANTVQRRVERRRPLSEARREHQGQPGTCPKVGTGQFALKRGNRAVRRQDGVGQDRGKDSVSKFSAVLRARAHQRFVFAYRYLFAVPGVCLACTGTKCRLSGSETYHRLDKDPRMDREC